MLLYSLLYTTDTYINIRSSYLLVPIPGQTSWAKEAQLKNYTEHTQQTNKTNLNEMNHDSQGTEILSMNIG